MIFTKKAALALAAAGLALAASAQGASADAGTKAATAGSQGLVSGNDIEIPVAIPINVCGNTIHVLGSISPAFANDCGAR